MNFRIRTSVLGTDELGLPLWREKDFGTERAQGGTVFVGWGRQEVPTQQGFYQSCSSSIESSQFVEVKVNTRGRNIFMLVCILNLLVMLTVAFGL